MAMYPSIEDMTLDQLAHSEIAVVKQNPAITGASAPASGAAAPGGLYANLGLEELLSYGGLDISPAALEQQMGSDLALATRTASGSAAGYQPVVAITQPNNVGVKRAEKKEGVRPVVVAKGADGKIGIAPVAIDNGVFVGFVWKDSAAAMAGVRFGDQVLSINNESVSGWTAKQTIKCLGKADTQGIMLAIRDRPYARPVTFQKNSENFIGCYIKKGAVSDIVKDSSAARNGLLTKHHVLEVNGQNVVGLADKDIIAIIAASPPTVTLTIIPSFVYKHLVDKIGFKKIKAYMDHSVPEV